MVDFKLSDEQRQYRELAFDFARKEIRPRAEGFDKSGQFPQDLYKQLFDLGLMNASVPEEFGGLGLSLFDACLIHEEIGAACTACGAALTASELAISGLKNFGDEKLKQEYLLPLTQSSSLAACLEIGSCVKATGNGDNYLLDDVEVMSTNAGAGSWLLVLAETQDKQQTALLVPLPTSGLTVCARQPGLGLRARDYRSLKFNQVKVSKENQLGASGDGQKVLARALAEAAPLMAAQAVGLARQAMEHAIVYAKERKTFGQAIAHHQAIAHLIADMAKDIEAARLMTWQAAWLADQGFDSSWQWRTSLAFAFETAVKVTVDAVQVFGGYGYSREYPVEKLMRDAKMLEITGGSAACGKVDIGACLVGIK